MQTTRLLTSRLREPRQTWCWGDLGNGLANPLIRSGVLTPIDVVNRYECPEACEGCSGLCVVHPIFRDDRTAYAWACELSGEIEELPGEQVIVWGYRPEKLAQLVCDALGCEGVTDLGDGLWSLGVSDCRETNNRPIVIMTRLDECSAKVFLKTIKGTSHLLLAANVDYDFGDPQIRRRVFPFDNVLRFTSEGSVRLILTEFINQLGDPLPPKKRASRTERLHRERQVANYLKDRAFEILAIREYTLRTEALREIDGASIATALDIPPPKISAILDLKGKNKDAAVIPQFWYDICTKEDHFFLFAKFVGDLPRQSDTLDATKLYDKLHKQMAKALAAAELAKNKTV